MCPAGSARPAQAGPIAQPAAITFGRMQVDILGMRKDLLWGQTERGRACGGTPGTIPARIPGDWMLVGGGVTIDLALPSPFCKAVRRTGLPPRLVLPPVAWILETELTLVRHGRGVRVGRDTDTPWVPNRTHSSASRLPGFGG